MKLVYVEEVFTLSFHAWELHVKTSVSIDAMKRGCLLDANPYRIKEPNFRISCSHALSSKSTFFLKITGKKFLLASSSWGSKPQIGIREIWLPKQVLQCQGNTRKSVISDRQIIFSKEQFSTGIGCMIFHYF